MPRLRPTAGLSEGVNPNEKSKQHRKREKDHQEQHKADRRNQISPPTSLVAFALVDAVSQVVRPVMT
jgi:hypothetical protein